MAMPDELGDSIYQRSADDASGTAALLASPKRSSQWHPAGSVHPVLGRGCRRPGAAWLRLFRAFPHRADQSIVADINMDGASVFYTFNGIIALGAPDSSLDAVVARNAARLGL